MKSSSYVAMMKKKDTTLVVTKNIYKLSCTEPNLQRFNLNECLNQKLLPSIIMICKSPISSTHIFYNYACE